jgi:hypothetical protein
MSLPFLTQLAENRLFYVKHASDFNAKQMSELAFLYLIALHILRSEYDTAPFAQNYARRTLSHNGFAHDDRQNTDLYQFLRVTADHNSDMAQQLHNPEANDLFWHQTHFSSSTAKQLLSLMARSSYDGSAAKRLLLSLESQLHITNSNYRSVRRLASEWTTPLLDTEQKQLTVTRLLQALRAKARYGDVISPLSKMAQQNRYELTDVCNPETGANCSTAPQASAKKPEFGLIKTLAVAAGIAVANHLLNKASKT